jgi:hypothetical protein
MQDFKLGKAARRSYWTYGDAILPNHDFCVALGTRTGRDDVTHSPRK